MHQRQTFQIFTKRYVSDNIHDFFTDFKIFIYFRPNQKFTHNRSNNTGHGRNHLNVHNVLLDVKTPQNSFLYIKHIFLILCTLCTTTILKRPLFNVLNVKYCGMDSTVIKQIFQEIIFFIDGPTAS